MAMLLAAGCGSGECDKTATACPYQMYGTTGGNGAHLVPSSETDTDEGGHLFLEEQ